MRQTEFGTASTGAASAEKQGCGCPAGSGGQGDGDVVREQRTAKQGGRAGLRVMLIREGDGVTAWSGSSVAEDATLWIAGDQARKVVGDGLSGSERAQVVPGGKIVVRDTALVELDMGLEALPLEDDALDAKG